MNNGEITFQSAAPLVGIINLSVGDVLAFINTTAATTAETGGNIGTYFATVISAPVQTSSTVITFSMNYDKRVSRWNYTNNGRAIR